MGPGQDMVHWHYTSQDRTIPEWNSSVIRRLPRGLSVITTPQALGDAYSAEPYILFGARIVYLLRNDTRNYKKPSLARHLLTINPSSHTPSVLTSSILPLNSDKRQSNQAYKRPGNSPNFLPIREYSGKSLASQESKTQPCQ